MTPVRKPGPAVVGVVAGQTATHDLTIGPTYHALYYSGTVKNTSAPPSIADIFGDIRVKRNGKIQRTHSGTQLDALQSFDAENLRASITGASGQLYGQVTAPALGGTFTGTWVVGDLITFTGGTLANIQGASKALFVVTAVGSSLPTALRVVNPGQYAVMPTSTVPVIVSSAAGTVGTGTVTPVASVLTSLAPNMFAGVNSASNGTNIPAVGDTCTFILGVFFADPSRSSFAACNAFAWPTKWPKSANPSANLQTNGDGSQQLQSLQIEIDIPNNTGTSLHAITADIETTKDLGLLIDKNGRTSLDPAFDSSSGTPLENIVKVLRTTIPYTAAGDLVISPSRRDYLQQIALFTQAGDNITKLQVVKDGETLCNETKTLLDETHCKRGMNELAIDPNRLDFVADYTDNPLDSVNLNGSNEFILTATLAAANATSKVITSLSRRYGPPD